MTYYEVLELAPDASPNEILAAYHRLALECHPDRHRGQERRFKAITEAFETLSDPQKRQKYDEKIRSSKPQPEPPFGTMHMDLESPLDLQPGCMPPAQPVFHYIQTVVPDEHPALQIAGGWIGIMSAVAIWFFFDTVKVYIIEYQIYLLAFNFMVWPLVATYHDKISKGQRDFFAATIWIPIVLFWLSVYYNPDYVVEQQWQFLLVGLGIISVAVFAGFVAESCKTSEWTFCDLEKYEAFDLPIYAGLGFIFMFLMASAIRIFG